MFGVWGSWIGVFLDFICLAAQMSLSGYVLLLNLHFLIAHLLTMSQLIGSKPDAENFFSAYIALPLIFFFYFRKAYSWKKYPSHRKLYPYQGDRRSYWHARGAESAFWYRH